MATQLLALGNSSVLRQSVGARLREIAEERFDMGRYVADLDAIAESACGIVQAERDQAEEIHRSQLARADFLLPQRSPSLASEDDLRWNYLRPWHSGIGRRKLFPGFHPGIYSERTGLSGPDAADPLSHYLRAGQPSGPWRHELITGSDPVVETPAGLRVALHLHVYYPELLPELLRGLASNQLRPELFVSVPSPELVAPVQQALEGFGDHLVVEAVPNRGRDIGPLLTAFAARLGEFDIVGHLHTKKTADLADAAVGDQWRRFLLDNLLAGTPGMMDVILGRMGQDESIGLVFPDDPYLVDWTSNLTHAQALCPRLGLDAEQLPGQFAFPVGTMFWSRVAAIRPLLELNLDWSDYPAEPLAYDGSMLHALERLLPFVVEQQGYRCALTNVDGVSR
jgi:hypothetical protein